MRISMRISTTTRTCSRRSSRCCEADFDAADLAWAGEIGRLLMDEFRDPVEGGFFFTSHDHESLIHRPKPGPDNATPSGNAVAAWALNRLAFLTGEMRLYRCGRARPWRFSGARSSASPWRFGTMLCALEELLEPPRTVILSGAEGIDGAVAPGAERATTFPRRWCSP